MTKAEYHRFAMDYGHKAHPVIVTDNELNALYFNPATAENTAVPLTVDGLRHNLSPRAVLFTRRLRSGGKPQCFLLNLGKEAPRTFKVKASIERNYLVFELIPQPSDAERKLRKQMDPLLQGFDHVFRNPLHQLLGISDLLIRNDAPEVQALGIKNYRQVLQALRIARLVDFASKDQPAHVLCFSKFLELVLKELTPFLKERFNVSTVLRTEGEGAAVQCNALLLKCVLFGMAADAMQYHRGDLLIRYNETADQVVLTIRHKLAEDEEPIPATFVPSPKPLGMDLLAELIRRQQGELMVQKDHRHRFYYLALPRTDTDGALKEHLQECMQSHLPELEIAFADLL